MCNLSQGVLELGLKEGLEKGLERGRAEGRAEGRIENQKKTALNLSKMGMPAEKIAEIIDASVKLVQEWVSGNENGNVSPAR